MKIYELQGVIHDRVLLLRSIEYLVNKPLFERLYQQSTHNEQANIRSYIQDLDRKEILAWMLKNLDTSELPVSALRVMAKGFSIKNYSRLPKYELIERLQNEKD